MTEQDDIDVMIDLETLGKEVESPIIAIAAYSFHRDGRLCDPDFPPFYVNVEPEGKGSLDSFHWWLRQSSAAQHRLRVPEPVELDDAIYSLRDWFYRLCPSLRVRVWAHGPSFDIAMLEYRFRECGQFLPWRHDAVRDTRTVYEAAGLDYRAEFEAMGGVRHDALEDARRQSLLVQKAWRRISEWAVRE